MSYDMLWPFYCSRHGIATACFKLSERRQLSSSCQFVWAHSGAYATRDSNGKITVFQAAYALVLCISSKMWIWNHIEIWLIARLQTWTCGRTSRRASPLSLSSMSKRSLEDCLSDQSAMFVKYLSNARLCWSFWGLDWPSLAGRLLGIRGGDFICFYDWTEQDTEICQTAKQMGGSKMWIIWGFGDCVNLRHLHKTRKREHFSCDIVAARYRLVRRIDVVPKDVIWWLAQWYFQL